MIKVAAYQKRCKGRKGEPGIETLIEDIDRGYLIIDISSFYTLLTKRPHSKISFKDHLSKIND